MFFPRSFPLFAFEVSQHPRMDPFSVLVPDLCPRKPWWPLVSRNAACAFKLGSKGDTNFLLFSARSGPSMWELRILQWDLWVI